MIKVMMPGLPKTLVAAPAFGNAKRDKYAYAAGLLGADIVDKKASNDTYQDLALTYDKSDLDTGNLKLRIAKDKFDRAITMLWSLRFTTSKVEKRKHHIEMDYHNNDIPSEKLHLIVLGE